MNLHFKIIKDHMKKVCLKFQNNRSSFEIKMKKTSEDNTCCLTKVCTALACSDFFTAHWWALKFQLRIIKDHTYKDHLPRVLRQSEIKRSRNGENKSKQCLPIMVLTPFNVCALYYRPLVGTKLLREMCGQMKKLWGKWCRLHPEGQE